MSELTYDTPAPGLVVAQPRRGFRYGSEPFWLVGFALEGGPAGTALDLGTGSGIAALLLGSRGVATRGYEVRPEWGPLWAETLRRSSPLPVTLEQRDVALVVPGRSNGEVVDLVVTNPPFFPAASGPVAPDAWKAAARTESSATLRRFVEVGLAALRPEGRFCAVVPVERLGEVEAAGEGCGASTRRVVTVGRRRALVELGAARPEGTSREVVGEGGERVRGWYARLAAGGPAA